MKSLLFLALVLVSRGYTETLVETAPETVLLDDVLDLNFYGLENQQKANNELEWVKEIFEVDETSESEEVASLEEDSDDDYSLEESESENYDFSEESEEATNELEEESEESEMEKADKKPCNKPWCKRWKKKLARKQQRKALKKQEDSGSKEGSEDSEVNGLQVDEPKKRNNKNVLQKAKWAHKKAKWVEKRQKRTHGKEITAKKCHGPVCRKIEAVVKKHEKMIQNLMVKVDEASQLCLVTDQKMRVLPKVLRKLGSQRHNWTNDWRSWQDNVNVCCDMEDPEELTECIKAVGPLSVPWKQNAVETKDENTSTAEKLTRVCSKIVKRDWSSLPERKLRRLDKHQELGSQDRDTLEEQWRERGQDIMDCCELSADADRLECLEDLRAQKIDDICDGQLVTVHPKKEEAFKECCTMEEEDRYECFDSLPKWRRSHAHHKKHVHNKEHGKKNKNKHDKERDPSVVALRQECCEQGREEGTAVHARRWATCQKDALRFTGDRQLVDKAANMCGKVLRRCCVRQSHRTTVDDIFTTTVSTFPAE